MGLSRVVIKQGPAGRPSGRSPILSPGTSLVGRPTWAPPPESIRGVTLDGLWSPGQPTHPISPAGSSPRGWQFLNYQNMIFTPRATEDYTFDDLRTLSRFPLVRALIESRKDQLANLPWQIRVKPKEGETNAQRLEREKGDSVIQSLTRFFERPSADCDWADFVGMWADEMLVHDAPSVLIRATRAGDIGELRVLDGAMIVKYVDANGWTPHDGSPAYAQLWWGMPAWNLTTDQLMYRPRCPRAHKLYGLSKNEIAAQYTELAWKRLEMEARHYCYSDDTEVMTRRGWLRFADTTDADDFATRNMETKEFEWQKRSKYVCEDFRGEMVNVHGRSISLLVTPNHRIVIDHLPEGLGGRRGPSRHERDYVVTAEELARAYDSKKFSTKIGIPQSSVWYGKEIGNVTFFERRSKRGPEPWSVAMTGDEYCAFMGMYLAEGSTRRSSVCIAQPKDARGTWALYDELLRRVFRSGVAHDGKQFEVGRSALVSFLKQFGHAHEKFIPQDILDATPRQMEIFWKFYHAGDGQASDGQVFTVSKALESDLCELIQKMGGSSTTWTRPASAAAKMPDGRTSPTREGYMVGLRRTGRAIDWSVSYVPYSGKVYCVTVPNHVLYVRRDGKTAWCGNTDGMVPDAIQMVPTGVSPKTITAQQENLRSQLAGNLARLSGLMLMQGFTKDGTDKLYFPKNELMVDTSIDDIITRTLCFIFGVSQQRLQRQMNRASAESSQEASEEEGLEPDKNWLKRGTNHLIQSRFGYPDHEFVFQDQRERDVLKQAQADQIYLNCSVNTINEIRKAKGDDPTTQKDSNGNNIGDMLYSKTPQGMVLYGDLAPTPGAGGEEEEPTPTAPGPGKTKKKPASATGPAANVPARGKKKKRGEDGLQTTGDNGQVSGSGKCTVHEEFHKDCGACREEALEGVLAEHMEKSRQAFQMVIDPHHFTPQSEQSRQRMQDKMRSHLKKCGDLVAARALRIMGKAEDNDALVKQIIDDDEFWTSLWAALPDDLEADLEDATLAGMTKSVVEAQVHITEAGMIREFNDIAKAWATQHSAAMIGMRRDSEGNLVPNPNTAYNISETTRDAVRKIIVEAFSKETPINDVVSAIKDAGTFSDDRAATIARTEVQMAQVQGNVAVWNKLGLVQTAKWQTSNSPGVCERCLANAAAGPVEFGQKFPSGDIAPGAHPNCRCVLVSVKLGRSQAAA